MRIGTPLSSSATRVMLLGSGELGKEVIIALQRLGVEVIAVDRYENAPGYHSSQRNDRWLITRLKVSSLPCGVADGTSRFQCSG